MTNALLHARAPGTAALLTIRPARAPPPNTDGTVRYRGQHGTHWAASLL